MIAGTWATGRRGPGQRMEEAGFSLIDLMVATTVMMAVTASMFSLLNPSQGIFQAQPEVSDMQQRLRVAADALHKDLLMAGAGTYSGSAAGTLGNFFAPILPFRASGPNEDPPGTFKSDTLSLLYVPHTSSQTTIASPMPATSSELKVNAEPGCPKNDPLCGFHAGMNVLIFDDSGSYDTFTITAVQSSALHLQHNQKDLAKSYGTGSRMAEVASHTYYLKTDAASDTSQLMHFDGDQSDLPLADHIAGLTFEYFGEASPPTLRKAVTDPVGPWTTYGPKPPALGVVSGTHWSAGENCTFQIDAQSGQQISRLATLGTTGNALVKLTAAQLTDGPWCPDPDSPNRFDADLLRIRNVRVTIRVQAAVKALRGPATMLLGGEKAFTNAGTAQGGSRFVPDQEIRFDVTPRNLNLGR